MSDVFISVGFNGLNKPQVSIESEGIGYRMAGAKYDGMGREILREKLNKRDADEIRRILDRIE